MPLISGLFFVIAAIFIEIAGFIVVGGYIGVLPTLVLLVVAMLVGIILLRIQGRGVVQRIREELEQGRVPDRSLVEGMMLILASILLIIPGFVSDIFGLLLFLPPIRLLLWRFMAKYVIASVKYTPARAKGQKTTLHETIIELDEDEYQAQGNEKSPWRRLDDEKSSK